MPRIKPSIAVVSTLQVVSLLVGLATPGAVADDGIPLDSPHFQVDGDGSTVKSVASAAAQEAANQESSSG